jgi:hypothetical protein
MRFLAIHEIAACAQWPAGTSPKVVANPVALVADDALPAAAGATPAVHKAIAITITMHAR